MGERWLCGRARLPRGVLGAVRPPLVRKVWCITARGGPARINWVRADGRERIKSESCYSVSVRVLHGQKAMHACAKLQAGKGMRHAQKPKWPNNAGIFLK